jgi:hypothetical protein
MKKTKLALSLKSVRETLWVAEINREVTVKLSVSDVKRILRGKKMA